MSYSGPLESRKMKRGREMMESLQSIITKGTWPDTTSKGYAELICDTIINGIFEPLSGDTQADQNSVIPAAKKRQRRDRTQQETAAASDSIPAESKRIVAGKKGSKMTNWMVTKNKFFVDGYKWKKYGNKKISNQKYQRGYYRCAEEHCPVSKHVQQVDDEHFEIIYFEDHNCQHQAHPDGFGSVPPVDMQIQQDDDIFGWEFDLTDVASGLFPFQF